MVTFRFPEVKKGETAATRAWPSPHLKPPPPVSVQQVRAICFCTCAAASMFENAHSSRNTVTWLVSEPLSSPASPVYWFSPEKALPAQQSSTTALPLLPSLGTYVQSTGALSTLFNAFELLAKALPASLICAFLFLDSQWREVPKVHSSS